MEPHGHTRPRGLSTLGLAAVVAAFLIFAIATIWLRQSPPGRTDLETDRAKERTERLAKVRENETRALAGYSWIDRSAGVVGLPLERAVDLAIPLLASKPVRAGALIPPPVDTNAPPTTATNAAPSTATNQPPSGAQTPPAAATPQAPTNAPAATPAPGATNAPPAAPAPKTSFFGDSQGACA